MSRPRDNKMSGTKSKSVNNKENNRKRENSSPCSMTRSPKVRKFSSPDFRRLKTPTKSPVDPKDYRLIELKNGLKALLISNPYRITTDPDWVLTYPGLAHDFTQFCEASSYISDSKPAGKFNSNPLFTFEKLVRSENCYLSLMVDSGSFEDPTEYPGLAHLCEHLVHHGSTNFPAEDSYRKYITNHSGYTNACTDQTLTNFHFQIRYSPSSFPSALDIFSDMIINPLFKAESIQREIESVDNEFYMRKCDNCLRRNHLLNVVTVGEDNHCLKKFMMGKKSIFLPSDDTMALSNVQNALKKFHKDHYRANKMSLVVQSPDSLDCLQEWVVDAFQKIPSAVRKSVSFNLRNLKERHTPYDTDDFRKCYTIKPTGDRRELLLTWALPPELWKDVPTKPFQYLAECLMEESEGGLPYYLRQKNWIIQFSAGCHNSGYFRNQFASLFQIFIVLTQKGRNQLNSVIETIFSFMKFLSNSSHRKLFEELRRIHETKFNRMRPGNSLNDILKISSVLKKYNPEDILKGNTAYLEYNEKLIVNTIKLFMPSTCNFMLLADDVGPLREFDRVEKLYGTQYMVQDIPESTMQNWENVPIFKEFSNPKPNPYFSKSLKIPRFIVKNECLVSNCKLKVTHYPCPGIVTPQIRHSLIIKSAKMFHWNAEQRGIIEIWLAAMRYATLSHFGPLMAIGTQICISANAKDSNLEVTAVGFNNDLTELLQLIVDRFDNFEKEITRERFEVVKDHILKSYFNLSLDSDFLACELVQSLKYMGNHLSTQISEDICDLTFEEFITFTSDFKKYMSIEATVAGAVDRDISNKVASILQKLNYLPTGNIPNLDYTLITKKLVTRGEKCLRIKSLLAERKISIVHNYYELSKTNFENMAICTLLIDMMQHPIFHQLRTIEQLGYAIYIKPNFDSLYLGISIVVANHSDKFSPCYINRRIDSFLHQFYKQFLLRKEFNQTFLRQNLVFKSVEFIRNFYKHYFLNEIDSAFKKISVQVVSCSDSNSDTSSACLCMDENLCKKSKWLNSYEKPKKNLHNLTLATSLFSDKMISDSEVDWSGSFHASDDDEDYEIEDEKPRDRKLQEEYSYFITDIADYHCNSDK